MFTYLYPGSYEVKLSNLILYFCHHLVAMFTSELFGGVTEKYRIFLQIVAELGESPLEMGAETLT